jgi:ribosomal protein S18 acetylase RimI-like enzyme
MTKYKVVITNGDPDPKDKKVLVDGLLAHHVKSGHPRKTDVFSAFIHDESGKPIGGIIVSFLWDGMHIDSLWVKETLRGQGLGKKLVSIAEKEAQARGSKVAYTDTFTWQAADFYKHLGYTTYGELIDFPEGYSLMYLQKRL